MEREPKKTREKEDLGIGGKSLEKQKTKKREETRGEKGKT